jgi:hypothetical protein
MARTRAADDFTTIRARMEELRREREGAETGEKATASDQNAFASAGLVRSQLPSGGWGTGRGRAGQQLRPPDPNAAGQDRPTPGEERAEPAAPCSSRRGGRLL